MEGPIQSHISEALESMAEALDIPPSKYREAVNHYHAVGKWLNDEGSPLRSYQPTIYPQGSFRIGTVVRPVKEGLEADYDIDLVCQLLAPKARLTATQLKTMVGGRLKDHSSYRRQLNEEGRRCWTLNYAEADGIGFHLDVLPALSEERSVVLQLVQVGVDPEYAQHAISITERTTRGTHVWVDGGSNPTGFALWFQSVNASVLSRVALAQKRRLFERNRPIFSSVQDVPEGLIRTPLQRAIQLLKRHRDISFVGHKWEDQKPISMIITTVAARTYKGEEDISSALGGILRRTNDFATTGTIEKRNGIWWVSNPVNPNENFADRWNLSGSHRAEAFFEWVSWVQQDLAIAEEQDTMTKSHAILEEAFGIAGRRPGTANRSGVPVVISRETVPALASTSHCQAPPWPLRKECWVKVSGSVRRFRNATRILWPLSNRPVPKDHWLRFEASTNTPEPFSVYWQVVNTGLEASQAGLDQLRGGFDAGEEDHGKVRWERTLYKGTHYIEAFVVKNGTCIARSGELYVRIR